jgi:hypothetical protein
VSLSIEETKILVTLLGIIRKSNKDLREDFIKEIVNPGNILTLVVVTTSGTGGEASVGVNILEKS